MTPIEKRVFIFLLFIIVRTTTALYGYDCGEQLSNITTISLVDIGDCEIEKPTLSVTRTTAQLIQLNDFAETQVISCSIKITRHITRCNMFSHSSRVINGEIGYYKDMTKEECKNLHNTGFYSIAGTPIFGISRDGLTQKTVNFAGTSDGKGNCEGGSYADAYGKWDNVVVSGWIDITLHEYSATINLDTNKIKLRSGLSCHLTATECVDYDGSHSYWNVVPETSCGEVSYSVLYEGFIEKAIDRGSNQIIYRVQAQDLAFALLKTGEHKTCGITLSRTEHPKLFILEKIGDNAFIERKPINAQNIDLFTYVNSKFVYLEKYLRGQITDMYYSILKDKCELERKVLANALSIATISPEEFGYRVMEETGYLGVVMGEVVHLVKCIKVEVTERVTDECYDQFPVYRGNESYFLSPRTRILVRTGRQIYCDQRLPAMYNLGNMWIKLLPGGHKADTPEILKPQSKPSWSYHTPESIAIGGIYGEKDVKRLRDMILFPIERDSVLNKVALGMSGRAVNNNGISIAQFIDKDTLEALAESTWRNLWGKFLTFGTASAGVIGLFLIFRVIKLILDTTIHGYAIYSLYGFSIHLIGALWNSVTQLLLHMAHYRENETENKKDEKEGEKTEKRETSIPPNETDKNKPEEKRVEHIYPTLHSSHSV